MVSWLSLAPTENDPALLTRYLIGALRRADAAIGERAETMLQVPGASPIAWMHSLVNDLAAVKPEITFVLDDYKRSPSRRATRSSSSCSTTRPHRCT